MKSRKFYLDWLRVYAIIAVIMIHVSAEVVSRNVSKNPVDFFIIGNFYESLARYAVPIFFMISGALLLGKNEIDSTTSFLKKRINKIFIPLFFWSCIYYAYKIDKGTFIFSIDHFIKVFLTDNINYHLWFMYSILGLYLVTPILFIFIKNAKKSTIEYFLLLWFTSTVLSGLFNFFFQYKFKIDLSHVSGSIGYFVLGYYLSRYELSKIKHNLLFFLGITGFLMTFGLTYYYTFKNGGVLNTYWYSNFAPNVLVTSAALFTFFKTCKMTKSPLPKFLNMISVYSFGIYLTHALMIYILRDFGIYFDIDKINPIFSIPGNIMMVLGISMLVVYLLKRIPVTNTIIP